MSQDMIDQLALELAISFSQLSNPNLADRYLGPVCLGLSRKFRALAIIALLEEADTDWFLHNLMRSARVRETLLKRGHAANKLDSYYGAAGQYECLLDAIASADWDVARNIGDLSAQSLCVGEFLDDHYYGRILHLMVVAPLPSQDIDSLIMDFEIYQDGEASVRLDLVKALRDRSQDDFEDYFEELLTDFETSIEYKKSCFDSPEPEYATEGLMSIEALAILRIAEQFGLSTEHEYPYCPSLARRPLRRAFQPAPELDIS